MTIPKLLHVVWLGSPLPDKFASNIGDWQLLNPDWKLNVWTQPLPGMFNEGLYDGASLYVKPDAVWQMRSDLLRYEILARYGGLYADVDTKPLRPIGDLFDGLSEFAVAEDKLWVGNTYLAAEPQHPAILDLLEKQYDHLENLRNVAAGVATGPQYMTPIWIERGCHVDMRTNLWFPYSWSDVRQRRHKRVAIPEDGYAIHQWNHSEQKLQRTEEQKRNRKEAGW